MTTVITEAPVLPGASKKQHDPLGSAADVPAQPGTADQRAMLEAQRATSVYKQLSASTQRVAEKIILLDSEPEEGLITGRGRAALAKLVGESERTVRRALEELVASGLWVRIPDRRPGVSGLKKDGTRAGLIKAPNIYVMGSVETGANDGAEEGPTREERGGQRSEAGGANAVKEGGPTQGANAESLAVTYVERKYSMEGSSYGASHICTDDPNLRESVVVRRE